MLLRIGLAVLAFVIIVRFLFSMDRKHARSKLSKQEVSREIERLKKDIQRLHGKIPNKEYGELMDDLMKEYYDAGNATDNPKDR